jgi:CheY-like chemotaxis protein
VRDTGKGIAADMFVRIFDMFVQGRGTLEAAERGLGIGLALARKLVELHGGTLTVHSEGSGKGSEFTVSIPMASAIEAAVPQPGAQPTAPARPRRVLVVDDNADAADSLVLLLQTLGHTTGVAHDGASALAMARVFLPEFVLLDIGMPGMSGHDVARGLRRLDIAQPRIIAVTGWGQEPDRSKSREAGFDLHLLKPVDLDQLMAALHEAGSVDQISVRIAPPPDPGQ